MARVRLFAALREAAGTDKDEAQAATVGELVDELKKRYGEGFSGSLKFASIAVNGQMITYLQGDETPLKDDDEVAFMPPVSGGSPQPAGAAPHRGPR